MHSRLIAQQRQCLVLQPCLVEKLGRTPSLFLQQVHYWMTCDKEGIGKVIDQRRWIYNSAKEWASQLCLSERQISRIINQLKEIGVLLVDRLSHHKSDRTNWYSINYQALECLLPGLSWQPEEASPVSSTPSSSTVPDKMSESLGHNGRMYNKETEITSEKFLSTEGRGGNRGKPVETQQVHGVEKENKLINKNLEPKNNLASTLLEIWNQTVRQGQGEGDSLVQLTKERAQYLVAAFKYRFESNLTKWKQFCQQITTSDFLMGKVRSTFKASLDWVLKFDTIQRILEGDFGVKTDLMSLENQPLQKDEEALCREIEGSLDSQPVKAFRLSILRTLGGQVYQSWFADVSMAEEGRGELALAAKTRFVADYIQTHYLDKLQSLVNHRINISSETG